MRVLVVSHYFSSHRGGVERVAGVLARALLSSGAGAVTWMASDCDVPEAPATQGLDCVPARSSNIVERLLGLPYPFWSLAALRRLWRAVGECDVLHLHDAAYMGNACACFFARWRGRPVVVTQHVGDIGRAGSLARIAAWLLHRTLTRLVLARADRVFFVSPQVQRYFEAFCRFRVAPACLPNGVDGEFYAFAGRERMLALRRAAGRDPARPLCLFVGRFVRRKGIELLMQVAGRMPDVDWIFAGNGVLRPEDAGIASMTVLRGRSPAEIVPLYQMADLLVLPSTGEGFPLVVQEALACGTPALVSADTAAGAPRAAESLYVESELSAERWQAHVTRLLADLEGLRAAREARGDAARRLWSWQSTADAYLQAMKDLCRAPVG
jgi:glycosyltransferase involved in cell wall biosynthesis